ncbi:MAG: DUF5694 domain-containing protein [Bacteroidota bacterium]
MRFYLLIPLLLFGILGSGFVSKAPSKRPTQIMLVGTHYLPADILRQSRQREMQTVVNALMPFAADQVLLPVGMNSREADVLDTRLQAYLAGNQPLNRSVEEQLGLRLAASLQHEHVYGFMQNESFRLNTQSGDISNFQASARAIELDKRAHIKDESVINYLSYLNHPRNLQREHSIYVQNLSRIGLGEDYAGADMLGDWYAYHVRMFANLTELSASAERVVVIVDSRHIPILQELIKADPLYESVSVEGFLLAR